ncbi:MAG: M3 family metallopeptidase [Acidobacteriaceae bacterium]
MMPAFPRKALLVFLLCSSVLGQDLQHQPTIWSNKPSVADFERIENERLAAAQRAIDQITAVAGSHGIENTLAPYDEAIRQLNTASYFSEIIRQVHPDAGYREDAAAMTAKVGDAHAALMLNRYVFDALGALDLSSVDAATRHYVQRQLLEFRLAGVEKDEATRAHIRQLQDHLTKVQTAFDSNINDSRNTVELTSVSQLEGLPQDYIDRHKPGPDGKIRITTDYPDIFPALEYARSEEIRRRLYEAFASRAYPKNRDLMLDMMRTRYAIAALMGYSSWADYKAADQMVGSGSNIAKFIHDLDAATRPNAEREYAMLLAEQRKSDPGRTRISIYNVGYLKESVRRTQYNFDSQEVRPYLPFREVQAGVLATASTLFHVTFHQELNAPAWDPSVETWDVFDGNRAIGRFYLDLHPRAGKYSHGEMAQVLDGVAGKQLPEAILVCNFPQPTQDDPGLMDYGDTITFFHEFGHLMHHILGGQQRWAGISGITMEADFSETPSQMLEEWMHSPQVLATFARHYKTGAPIPADLVARMNRASAFGRADFVIRQIGYSALAYDLHKSNPQGLDPDVITLNDMARYSLADNMPVTANIYANFPHLADADYSSGYYMYMWDQVIAQDFFGQFDKNDLLASETAMRYRRTVLEPGGSMSANDLVKNFLGRPQNMVAFQQWVGEEFEERAPSAKPAGQ